MAENQVDVQKIMEEIKAEITAKGLVNDIPAMEELALGNSEIEQQSMLAGIDTKNINQKLKKLKSHKIKVVYPITSYYKIFSPFVKLFKHIIQKLCFFLLQPIVKDINGYNRKLGFVLDEVEKSLKQSVKMSSVPVDFDKLNSRVLQVENISHTNISNQILLVRDYKQLANQYATSNHNLEKELERIKEYLQSVTRLEEDYIRLKLQFERSELETQVLKMKIEKLEME